MRQLLTQLFPLHKLSDVIKQPSSKRIKEKDRKKKKLKSIIQTQSTTIPDNAQVKLPVTEIKSNVAICKAPEEKRETQEATSEIEAMPQFESMQANVQDASPNNSPIEDMIPEQTLIESVESDEQQPQPVKAAKAVDDGFCFVISMHDGVILHITAKITNSLGFPSDMWLGEFISFIL